ncbi:hypothetical protein AMS68_006892 [Peltaster fructicola]|uniref:NACHT domain-containing protein n=1 Tax=Peltaster fructicola TaxID=286661 RepID=A0A6H0Y372_9PEZI|nr:hypothetical protein AMS68_006892 [Peltaster fructicola]
MRLLYVDEQGRFVLTDDLHDNIPRYAILSHTWSDDGDEVTYQDILQGKGQEKEGYAKLCFCRDRGKEAGIQYFWVDTCCIDKASESELATSIRSMFRWYAESAVCWAYLIDVSSGKRNSDGSQGWHDTLRTCRWFTRGWTLQELLAPKELHFYARSGYLGNRSTLCQIIHEITGIDAGALQGQPLDTYPHLHRLGWAAARVTKIAEDRAYALLGICDISMGPRYGEGYEHARRRLESKIVKRFGTRALERIEPPAGFSMHQQTRQDEHRQRVLEMLKFDAMESRRTTIKKALDKTCSWVLDTASYKAWMQPDVVREHHGFLWIKGKPGAGKSVLMKFLDDHVHSKKLDSDIVISFYFSARGEELERTLLGMYRSLSVQLLEAVPEMQSVLDSSSMSMACGTRTQITELKRIISTIVSKLGRRRLYLFMDALDECQQDDIQSMIDFFQDLGEDAKDEGLSSQVCFASRHYPLLDIPTGLQLVLEDANEHSHDLERYIRRHLRVGGAKKAGQIHQDVLDKANGVFLWVVLVVDILSKEFINGRIFAVQKRLQELPPGLNELFQDIISRDGQHLDEFMLCLQWILYAKRPLELKEYYFAMLSGSDPKASLEWDEDEVSEQQMHRFLLSSSKGLAELAKGKKMTVQFIHESVRDFLIKENGLQVVAGGAERASEASAHEVLKSCCLRGMVVESSAYPGASTVGACLNELACPIYPQPASIKEAFRSRYPLMSYATQFILSHAEETVSAASRTTFLQTVFDLNDWRMKYNLTCKYGIDEYKPGVSLSYVLAERDLVGLLEAWGTVDDWASEQSACRHPKLSRAGRYGIPLLAALATKSIRASRLLLRWDMASDPEKIVDDVLMQSQPKHFRGLDQVQPDKLLRWAARCGHERLFLHLVKSHKSAVPWGGLVPVVVSAEQYHMFRHFPRKYLPASLDGVTYYGTWRLLELSTQIRDSVWAKRVNALIAEKNYTALGLAIDHLKHDDVRRLIDAGADLMELHKNETPLIAAIEKGDQTVVHWLIEAGAEVDAVCLARAVELHDHTIAQRLIEADIRFDCTLPGMATACSTVLFWCVEHCSAAIMSRLLAANISLNGTNHWGSSALHLAILQLKIGHAKLLIAAGIDANLRDRFSKTALDLAIESRIAQMVEVFVTTDSALTKDALVGISTFAIRYDHGYLVELCIQREVPTNAINALRQEHCLEDHALRNASYGLE